MGKCFFKVGNVPEKMYEVPIGKGIIRKKGNDLTVVAISYMAALTEKVINESNKFEGSIELIDPRTVKPLDKESETSLYSMGYSSLE